MEYEEIEKLSLEESKRQTKERREHGLNMIRPFTFDEKKMLWDGLREDNKVFILGFNEKLSKPIKNISYIPLGSNDSKLRFIIVSLMYSLSGGYLFKFLKYLISYLLK